MKIAPTWSILPSFLPSCILPGLTSSELQCKKLSYFILESLMICLQRFLILSRKVVGVFILAKVANFIAYLDHAMVALGTTFLRRKTACMPIQILHRLGHCVDYNFVCEIETAQAETAQMLATASGALHLKPASRTETVLTYFWADNFDMNLETQTGKGALNSTHLVAFQEESQNSVTRNNKIFLPRTKRRESRNIQLKLLQIPNENRPL